VQHTAERLHLGVLKARADEYVDQNFEAVTKTEEWQMLPASAVGEVLSRDKLRPGGEIQVFHALVRWAKCVDGGGGGGYEGGGTAGGGGESKEGDQEEGREAQFVDLLGRCVRASQLSSKNLSLVVLREPLVQGSLPAVLSMMRVLQERTVGPADAALFASPEPLCRRRADAMIVTKIFAVGGKDGMGTRLSRVECFDPSMGEWSGVADMTTVRCAHGVGVVDGKLYTAGGYDATNTFLSSVECFDPSTGQWSAVAAMSTARYYLGVAVVDGKLYVVGGVDGTDTRLSSVECFDPSTGQWSALRP
jgi:hypothetical protein